MHLPEAAKEALLREVAEVNVSGDTDADTNTDTDTTTDTDTDSGEKARSAISDGVVRPKVDEPAVSAYEVDEWSGAG